MVGRVLAAQRGDSSETEAIDIGVIHRHLTLAAGPWSVHVIEVDLRQPGLSIRAAHSNDLLAGRETLRAIVQRKSASGGIVLAAINADFFNLATGEDENNQVIEGEIWKGVKVADAPADSGHHVHSQFAVAGSGRPLIEPLVFHGAIIRAGKKSIPLDGINAHVTATSIVLFTPRVGMDVPFDSLQRRVHAALRFVSAHGDTSTYRVVSLSMAQTNVSLAAGPVLSFPASMNIVRDVPRAGETIRIQTNLQPAPLGLRTVVGGWPRIVVHGVSTADSADRLEGTAPSFSVTRHPRSGVGMSRDSTTLYLVSVDGRQESSSGMSLKEFADLMVRLGVYEGLNLDGGGSTTMMVRGDVVNVPSDRKDGKVVERTVGNALLVVRNERE